MATAAFPAAHAGEIKFVYGRPEVFALKFLEPKVYDGTFGPRGMFTACDEGQGERKIWMDYEDASNLVIELRRLRIRVGEPIQLTKIKHDRGGGHGYLVKRAGTAPQAPAAEASAPPAWVTDDAPAVEQDIATQLAQSVQMVRQHGPQVFRQPVEIPAAKYAAPAAPEPAPAGQPADSVLMAALKMAIDAASEASAYAARKGMALAFGPEDIRALAATVYIQNAKGGR